MKWWGYKHSNGTLLPKRYFDERDIDEALESPFVDRVYGPFEADGREDALRVLQQKLVQ